MYKDERELDFTPIGKAIKEARVAQGMTQEELAQLLDYSPRNVMYIENRGQYPRLNTFYKIMTILKISVDKFFFPMSDTGKSPLRSSIDMSLDSLTEQELIVVQATMEGLIRAREKDST